MYKENRKVRRERLANAYDKADEAYELAIESQDSEQTIQALLARREAIWQAYKRLGIGFWSN